MFVCDGRRDVENFLWEKVSPKPPSKNLKQAVSISLDGHRLFKILRMGSIIKVSYPFYRKLYPYFGVRDG